MAASRPTGSTDPNPLNTVWAKLRETNWFVPALQTAVTIPAVVAATYPLDVLTTLKQAGSHNAYRPQFFGPYFILNWRVLFKGFLVSNAQAGVKNGVLTQRDSVHGVLKERMASEEDHVLNMHGEYELPSGIKIKLTLATTGVIATADLVATNYWANLRLTSQLLHKPELGGVGSKAYFASLTAPMRFMSLYSSALGVVAGNILLREPIEKFLPQSQFGILGSLTAAVLPGFVLGPLSNIWNVVRVNQMKELDPKTLSIPSAWNVAKDLYAKDGYKVFMRGGVMSAAYATFAYGAIGGVDYLFNEILFPKEAKSTNKTVPAGKVSQQGIFSGSAAPRQTVEEVLDNEVEKVKSTARKNV